MEPNTTTLRARSPLLKVLAVFILVAIAAVGYLSWSGRQAAPQVTFTDLQGNRITSDSLRGKVVMVNFWATSCTTCIHEMPEMVRTYNKYKDQGLEYIGVAMSYDPPNYVLNYAQTRNLPFKVALDTSGSLAKSFGEVKLTPTTYVIDKQGNIIKRYVGEPEFAQLDALLQKALKAKA